jgi:hypothetical protein
MTFQCAKYLILYGLKMYFIGHGWSILGTRQESKTSQYKHISFVDWTNLADKFYRFAQDALDSKLREDHYNPEPNVVLSPLIEKREHKEFLCDVAGMSVYLVDGGVIRNNVDIDFTGGGNPARYEYIQEPEIWVEKFNDLGDCAAYALHEITEFYLMKDDDLSYDDAHEKASEVEMKLRNDLDGMTVTRDNVGEIISEYLANHLTKDSAQEKNS